MSLTIKQIYLLLAFLSTIAIPFTKACHLSDVTLMGVCEQNGNVHIQLRLCMGGGTTGFLSGADADTDDFAICFYRNGALNLLNWTPPFLVADSTGGIATATNTGPQGTPFNCQASLLFDVQPPTPFMCVGNPACGGPHQQCFDISVTLDLLPDSLRVFGVEGAGNPLAGCTFNPDMGIDFTGYGPYTECVWPGDPNDDNVADNADYLQLGLAAGVTGTQRPVSDCTWTAQYSAPWALNFPGGLNHKHGDCNGDGTINIVDGDVITLHYGLTHPRRTGGGSVPLWIDPVQTTGNDTVLLDVHLGTALNGVNELYGIAWNFSIDSSVYLPGSFEVSFPPSFMGTPGADLWGFARLEVLPGRHDMALTANDLQNNSGNGAIARLRFVRNPDIFAQSDSAWVPFDLEFRASTLADGTEVLFTAQDSAFWLVKNANGLAAPALPGWTLAPNPTTDQVVVDMTLAQPGKVTLRVTDLYGRTLLTQEAELSAGTQALPLNLADLSAGTYFVELATGGLREAKRLVIIR